MNLASTVLLLLVVLSWASVVQLAIWRPRAVATGSAQAQAYSGLRYASVGMLLSYIALVTPFLGPPDGNFFVIMLALIIYGTVLQTPLSLVALAVDSGWRAFALAGIFLMLLLTTGFVWYSFIIALLSSENGTPLQTALAFLATVLAGGATASILEIYVAVRRPRSQWGERV